jgi:predicted PurR-regulated permease PerM
LEHEALEKYRINFNSPSFKQRLILLSLWIIIACGLFSLRAVLFPFILALLIAYVFHPLVNILERVKIKKYTIPRFVSVLIIYCTLFLILILISLIFIPQFYHEMLRLAKEATILLNSLDENIINNISHKLNKFFRSYQIPIEVMSDVPDNEYKNHWVSLDLLNIYKNTVNNIVNYIRSETTNIIASAQHILSKIVSFVFMIFLIFMITGFLLVDSDRIKKFFLYMIPARDQHSFKIFLSRLDQRLSGVVRGQLTICVINAFLTLVGLLLLNIKFAIILATIAGILSLVPIFGSIISTVPIVLVALTISPFKALLALFWIVGIHALEANFLNPKIMSNSAKIHPVLVVLSLVAGERFYGIIGALLAVPIMSIITTIFMSALAKAKHLEEGLPKSKER